MSIDTIIHASNILLLIFVDDNAIKALNKKTITASWYFIKIIKQKKIEGDRLKIRVTKIYLS